MELGNSDLAIWKEFQACGTSYALDEGSVLLLDDLVYETDMGALGARTDESLRSFLEENDEMDCADVMWVTSNP